MAKEPERKGRYLGKWRSRHPYLARTARNVAIVAGLSLPLALSANRRYRKVIQLATGEKVPITRFLRSLKGRLRYHRGYRGEAREAVKFIKKRGAGREARRLFTSARHRAGISSLIGGVGGLGAVGFPASDYYVQKSINRQGLENPHQVIVVNKKTKEVRRIYA